jgi:hypothetical protein
MVTRIDRLARSIGDLQDIVRALKAKGEKCTQVQAGQTIASYSFSGISGSSSNWCWTFIPVAGHVKTKWATVNLWGRGNVRP